MNIITLVIYWYILVHVPLLYFRGNFDGTTVHRKTKNTPSSRLPARGSNMAESLTEGGGAVIQDFRVESTVT